MLSTAQLEVLAERWRSQDAPLLEMLRPGLSEEEMDALTEPLDIRLPVEARLWWGWHDGVDLDRDAPGSSELGPNRSFVSLHTAVSECDERREIARDVTDSEADAERMWGRAWFPITAFGDYACDCSVPDGQASPVHFTNYHYTETPDTPVAESFGEMVDLWIQAIDSGAWYYDFGRGRWLIRFDALDPELEKTRIV